MWCASVCVVYTHVHLEARGQPPPPLRQVWPEAHQLCLAEWVSIYLEITSMDQHFYPALGSEPRASCSQAQHFSAWATSPACASHGFWGHYKSHCFLLLAAGGRKHTMASLFSVRSNFIKELFRFSLCTVRSCVMESDVFCLWCCHLRSLLFCPDWRLLTVLTRSWSYACHF